MMIAGAVTSRVYEAAKQRVLSGALVPGARLDPAKLADELTSSVTPVRDALNHLVGETLIEARPNEGFFVPHMNEPLLRDRYGWCDILVKLAFTTRKPRREAHLLTPEGRSYAAHVRRLFEVVGSTCENHEHRRSMAAAIDRLEAVRQAEEIVLDGCAAEVDAISQAIAAGERKVVIALFSRFHRRRIRATSLILTQLYRP